MSFQIISPLEEDLELFGLKPRKARQQSKRLEEDRDLFFSLEEDTEMDEAFADLDDEYALGGGSDRSPVVPDEYLDMYGEDDDMDEDNDLDEDEDLDEARRRGKGKKKQSRSARAKKARKEGKTRMRKIRTSSGAMKIQYISPQQAKGVKRAGSKFRSARTAAKKGGARAKRAAYQRKRGERLSKRRARFESTQDVASNLFESAMEQVRGRSSGSRVSNLLEQVQEIVVSIDTERFAEAVKGFNLISENAEKLARAFDHFSQIEEFEESADRLEDLADTYTEISEAADGAVDAISGGDVDYERAQSVYEQYRDLVLEGASIYEGLKSDLEENNLQHYLGHTGKDNSESSPSKRLNDYGSRKARTNRRKQRSDEIRDYDESRDAGEESNEGVDEQMYARVYERMTSEMYEKYGSMDHSSMGRKEMYGMMRELGLSPNVIKSMPTPEMREMCGAIGHAMETMYSGND